MDAVRVANQKIFTTQEWRHVVILCQHCGTRVTLDLAEFTPPVSPRPGGRNTFAPEQCPTCKAPYHGIDGLADLQRGYRKLSQLDKGIVTFLVEVTDDD